ncbi:Hpt domain-containing protein [Sulfurimonas sp.]
MLIYNHKKEFLGVDEKDLKKLGLDNLAALKAEAADFADLFIKKPGYIHNFKHVHWIDFISCAESTEESKALINVNSQTFQCIITIDNAYLVDNPDSPAYIVHLNNLRTLRDDETQTLSLDSFEKPTPRPIPKREEPVIPPTPVVEESYEQLEVDFDEFDSLDIQESVTQTQTTPQELPHDNFNDMLDVGDLSIDVDETPSAPLESQPTPQKAPTPQKTAPAVSTSDVADEYISDYQYDPSIASKELGLPLDLIEEFIQDFIDQAKDFKEGLYNALESDDIESVKILSHKLKGVAANLRIEDAHEILSVINATSDMNVIKTDLEIFYKIIAKLAGEEVAPATQNTPVEEPTVQEEEMQTLEDDAPLELNLDEDDFTLDFKENETPDEETPIEMLNIEDSEVPQQIDLPELADDDFLEDNFEIKDDFDDDSLYIGSDEKPQENDIGIEYSKKDVANEIGIDFESFNELFEDFVQESHAIFQRINTAVKQNDYTTCRSEALQLKGMSDNMRLHEFTNELEILIHSSDKDEIAQALEKIDKTITKISKVGA